MVTVDGRFKRSFAIASGLWALYLLLLLPWLGEWRTNQHYLTEVSRCWNMYVSGDTATDAVALRACRQKAKANAGNRAYSGFAFDFDEGERWSLEGYYAHSGQRLFGLIVGPPIAAYMVAWVFFWLIQTLSARRLRMRHAGESFR